MDNPSEIGRWRQMLGRVSPFLKSIPLVWPKAFRGVADATLLAEIERTERLVRGNLDATIRAYMRRGELLPLSPIEAWHLAERMNCFVQVWMVAVLRKMPFPDFEDEEDQVEGLMIDLWEEAVADQWLQGLPRRVRKLAEDGLHLPTGDDLPEPPAGRFRVRG